MVYVLFFQVVTDKLGKQYYKQKGVVKELIDDYTAEVKMIDGGESKNLDGDFTYGYGLGDVLRLDQVHCETVIPAIGKPMLIVNGAYRGTSATLEAIDEAKFALSLTLAQGHAQGRKLTGIPYEDACKLA